MACASLRMSAMHLDKHVGLCRQSAHYIISFCIRSRSCSVCVYSETRQTSAEVDGTGIHQLSTLHVSQRRLDVWFVIMTLYILNTRPYVSLDLLTHIFHFMYEHILKQ